MTQNPLCIYHAPCADGFTAAWAVGIALNWKVDFHPGTYGEAPPDVTGRDVIIVDYSYKRPVLLEIAAHARTMQILDHHKSAAEDLQNLFAPRRVGYDPDALVAEADTRMMPFVLFAVFDMERSGAGLTWDFFNPGKPRPKLVDYVEDRDLWRFKLLYCREISAMLFSHDYDFGMWSAIADDMERPELFAEFAAEGKAIERKHHKDIRELLPTVTRQMRIGGFNVPVANLPYTLVSDAGNALAIGQPFAACYFDTPTGRSFSLRSNDRGEDVSKIAASYGGGGHRNAAGFRMPLGWDGDEA